MSDRVGIVACGALAVHVRRIARRRGWPVDVVPVPALLHNHPKRIPGAVAARVAELRERYAAVAVAYADCGTYGALDAELEGSGVPRLRGDHCYDVFGGTDVQRALEAEPGTPMVGLTAPGGVATLAPTLADSLDGARTKRLNRCPGSAAPPAPDGSSPWRPEPGTCDLSQGTP